jgi:hypothetical protein
MNGLLARDHLLAHLPVHIGQWLNGFRFPYSCGTAGDFHPFPHFHSRELTFTNHSGGYFLPPTPETPKSFYSITTPVSRRKYIVSPLD